LALNTTAAPRADRLRYACLVLRSVQRSDALELALAERDPDKA